MVDAQRRPFSVEQKLVNFESHLPAHEKAGEFRLLYIEPAYRDAVTFCELLETLTSHCISQGVDLAVIAGTTRQLRLYRHMGFVPFGPLVRTP
jgi:N-acetylglutamate synthase-like GNAT family acetyltransferase